jgi:methyl-accepting chemotaxis protein
MAFYSPHQATSLGSEILINDTRFIAKLLADNLSLGMQTAFIDDGAALDQTLSLLKKDGTSEESTISNVWVYDIDLALVASLNDKSSEITQVRAEQQFVLVDEENQIKVWLPMYDASQDVIGYVDMEFSKLFLQEQASQTAMTALLLSAILIGLVIVAGLFVGTRMAKPISKLSTIAKSVAVGDIHCDINIDSKGEIGELADAFRGMITYMTDLSTVVEQIAANNLTVEMKPRSDKDVLGHSFKTMIDNLRIVFGELNSTSSELVDSASELSTTSSKMSAGAQDQSDQIHHVTSAIEEMTATIVETAKNASDATNSSKNASDIAAKGGDIVSDTIVGMQRISDVVSKSAASIRELSNSSDKIGEIVEVIDDIADQTNLLALNAAIEAARAGEQGRGFAVVADEVRKLAERTGKATSEISSMVKGIQDETTEAVRSMELGISEVDKGRAMADQAGNSLEEIVRVSQQVMDMIQQIATAAEEQSTASEEITKNIEQIAVVTRETAKGTEQSAAATEQLNRQAEGIQKLISAFKIEV